MIDRRRRLSLFALFALLPLLGCGPVVEHVVAVDDSCAPLPDRPIAVGQHDISVTAPYEASLRVLGGAPEEAGVWVLDGNASQYPQLGGVRLQGEIAGMPTPDTPRLATLTQQASEDGAIIFGLELLTAEEVGVMASGVIGAQLDDLFDRVPLTIGVRPTGAPAFNFSIELCRGCLVDELCTLERVCRPAQDEPNRCQ